MSFNQYSLDLESSSSQYASIADASQTGLDLGTSFTFEIWVKFESLPTSGNRSPFFSKYTSTGNQRSYLFNLYNSTGTLKLEIITDSDGTGSLTSASVNWTPTTGVWYHVAGTCDTSSNTTKFYVNGTQQGSTQTGSMNAPYNSTAYFAIGENNALFYLDGLLNNAMVFSDVRSLSEIQADMFDFSPSDANLQGHWKLNNDYTDETANGNDLTASGSPVFSTNVPWTGANSTDWSPPYEIQSDNTKVSGSSDLTDFPALISSANLSAGVYAGFSQQTVTATHLETSGSATNASSYATGSVSLSANKLVLLSVISGYSSSPNTPTVTGASRTWTLIDSQVDESGFRKVSLFRSLSGSANSGALTIDFAGQTQLRCAWSINEFGNVDSSGTNGANAIVQSAKTTSSGSVTSITATLGSFSSSNNATFGVCGIGKVATGDFITAGTGFTELGETYIPAEGAIIQTQWRNDNDTSVDWSFSSGVDNSGIAVEIKAGVANDLRITTDSAGTTEVPFEVVNIDTGAETCEIWAKVPTLSYNSNTSLYIWYGNSSALPYSASDSFGSQNVWTDQKARYHAETLTFDSTSNGYTLTNNNSVVNATGKIGSSADFGDQSGSKKSLSRTDAMAIDLTGNWTIGFWVNVNTAPATNEQQYIVDIRSTTGTARYQLIKYRDTSGTKQVEINSGGTTTTISQTFTTSTWYHYVVNKNSSTMTVYINGSSIGTGSFGSTANADNNTRIGTALDGASSPAKVIVDEVFFTTQNLSADWIATEYNNQNDPGAFWSEIGSSSPSSSESASPSSSPSASESASPSSSPSASESSSPSLSPSSSESRSPSASPSASPSPSSSPSASESRSPSASPSPSSSPSASESRSPSASPSPSSSPSSSESPSPSSSISSSPSPSVGSSPSSSPSASESRSPSASPSPSSSESASESSSPSSSESSSPSPSPSSSESPSPSSSISATPSPSPSSSESRSPSSSQSPSSSESASESSSISASVSLSPSASESASPSSSISASPSPAQYADKYDESVGNTYIDKYKNWYT